MKKYFLSALLYLCFLNQAFAAVDEEAMSVKNRKAKEYSIALQLFGFGPTASITNGIHAGYFIDSNSLLQVEILAGNDPVIWGTGRYTISSYSVGTYYKLFMTPTFYIKLGTDFKNVRYKYEDDRTGGTEERTEFTGNSLGGHFSVGHQWQWQNFTFGFDWIGISAPFISQIQSTFTGGATPNQRRLDGDQSRYLKDNIIIILHGYLGASF